MNKKDREEHLKLLNLCLDKDRRIWELEKELNEAQLNIRALKQEVKERENDIHFLKDEFKIANRRASQAMDTAEEAGLAAGHAGRVSIRLMDHVDEYVTSLKNATSPLKEPQPNGRR